MYLKAINFMKGNLLLEIRGVYLERFLNLCAASGIAFWDLEYMEPYRMRARMSVRGFLRLRKKVKKTGCRVRILRREGILFQAGRFRRRYALWAGAAVLFALLWSLTSVVWSIEITGYETIDPARLMAYLAEEGIRPGISNSGIEPAELRHKILPKMDELSWLTVVVHGSHLIVDVRERRVTPVPIPEDEPCDIIATSAGLVTVMRVRQGTPSVTDKMLVEPGQTLVRGVLERADGSVRYVHAMAEIYARVWHTAKVAVPLEGLEKRPTGENMTRYALEIGPLRVNFYFNSSIPYEKYDKIMDRQVMRLGDSLRLPFALVQETYTEYETVRQRADETAVADMASDAAQKLASAQATGGYITGRTLKVDIINGALYASVTGESVEQIGAERRTAGK